MRSASLAGGPPCSAARWAGHSARCGQHGFAGRNGQFRDGLRTWAAWDRRWPERRPHRRPPGICRAAMGGGMAGHPGGGGAALGGRNGGGAPAMAGGCPWAAADSEAGFRAATWGWGAGRRVPWRDGGRRRSRRRGWWAPLSHRFRPTTTGCSHRRYRRSRCKRDLSLPGSRGHTRESLAWEGRPQRPLLVTDRADGATAARSWRPAHAGPAPSRHPGHGPERRLTERGRTDDHARTLVETSYCVERKRHCLRRLAILNLSPPCLQEGIRPTPKHVSLHESMSTVHEDLRHPYDRLQGQVSDAAWPQRAIQEWIVPMSGR